MEEKRLSRQALRKKAVKLYKNNWKVSEICATLGCSRTWFYKWLNRYDPSGGEWYKGDSRKPRSSPTRVDQRMEQLVLGTRKRLMSSPYSQYGPQAIYYSMLQKGYTAPPVWTIARILKRHNRVRPRRKGPYHPKGKKYPYLYALCHQMDFAGPRYLRSKARFYFLTLIDQDSHFAQTSIFEHKTSRSACDSLVRFWKKVGIPDFLQVDNDLAFWGSLRRPEAVGKVIRLCLVLGVTPIFIPLSEPWRNGVIERFNSTMQGHLLRQEHGNIGHLRKAARHFDTVHNQTHHYSTQNGMTPLQAFRLLGYPIASLNHSFQMPKGTISLTPGEVHIIRFIRSDLKFNLFGLSFPVSEKARHEYVKGIILTHEHRLSIFLDRELICEYEFILL